MVSDQDFSTFQVLLKQFVKCWKQQLISWIKFEYRKEALIFELTLNIISDGKFKAIYRRIAKCSWPDDQIGI